MASSLVVTIHFLHGVAAVLLLGAGLYCLRYWRRPTVLPVGLFCLLAGLWAASAVFIFHAPDLEAKILLNRIKFIAPILLPLTILAMATAYRDRQPWSKWVWGAICSVPAISLYLTLHPSKYELLIGGYRSFDWGGYQLLAFENGPWFVVHNWHARLTVIVALFLILTSAREMNAHHRARNGLFVLAILIPFIGDAFAVTAMPEFRYLQITPTLLLFTASTMVWVIARHAMVDVIPFARSYILDHTGDVYLVFDDGQRLVDFNRPVRELLGIDKSMLGQSMQRLGQEVADLKFLEGAEPALAVEFRKNGEWYEVVRRGLNEVHSGRVGTLVTFKNITLRKMVEANLEESNRLRTKIFAVLGHDMQENLIQVAMSAQRLIDESSMIQNDKATQVAEGIRSNARNSIEFIGEILDWAKSELGLQPKVLGDVQPEAVASDVAQFLRPLINARGVKVQVMSQVVDPVRTDVNALRVILRNLLINAIKFSPAGGTVYVAFHRAGDGFRIVVEDRGSGLAADEINAVFDPARQIPRGMGLYLCRDFVQRLGGRIWAAHEVGRGCQTLVFLPHPDSQP